MNKGGIVERFCDDLRIAQNRDINHLLYLYLYSNKNVFSDRRNLLYDYDKSVRLSEHCGLWRGL